MKRALAVFSVVFASTAFAAFAQTGKNTFPPVVFTAKTVAIVNDTKSDPVEKGAISALKAWGQFTVVDDPQVADVTLRFDKGKEHDGESTHKTDANGNPTDYNYSMSFSSSVRMKAYYKDEDSPFYTTKTGDSKTQAGISCINDFRGAYRLAQQRH